MRPIASLAPAACGLVAALALLSIALTAPGLVRADDRAKPSGTATCSCPSTDQPRNLWPRPKYAELRPALDGSDEVAALEALHLALTEVGDGSTYVWHRANGRLSGLVQPTSSFKDASGKVCRHIVMVLSAGASSRKAETIACRLATGVWQVDG